MTRRASAHILLLFALALGPTMTTGDAKAATTAPLNINYTLVARATLNLTPATINFPDGDPTSLPSVAATENPVVVTAKIRKDPSAALLATLVCQGGPLVSGGDQIPSSGITWTATGTGFTGGTLSSATPQQVGNWTTSGTYIGNLNFRLANLWTYAIGSYTGSITYTLTAP
ncbi:hypothetical protein [Geomobilimonas luticola]|uniref:Ig-like domain-containing protein n=1 Tax=Geomobilimonas luticola TaxID=1114878 RepID=A0ABS5SF75_9BACT|nr:hypothetical protein [Geomobilimonas luticola]MBT0653281.1 hypothetical protein [Geomobilimonas luticola]